MPSRPPKRKAAAQKINYSDKRARGRTRPSASRAQPEVHQDDGSNSDATSTYLEHRRNAPRASYAASILAPATSEANDAPPEPTQTTLADPAETLVSQLSADESEIRVNTARQDEENLRVDDRQSSSGVDTVEDEGDESEEHHEQDRVETESERIALEELAIQCRKLVDFLRSYQPPGSNHYSASQARILAMRRKMFHIVREQFSERTSSFIDIGKSGDIGLEPGTVAMGLARANLATTLDLLQTIQYEAPDAKPDEDHPFICDILEEIDDFFARLFQPFADLERDNTMLHLNIRTMRVVEELANRPQEGTIELIAELFFDQGEEGIPLTQENYATLFTGNRLKDLSCKYGEKTEAVMKLVRARIADIISTIQQAEESHQPRAEALRAKFDKSVLIPEIRKWILETYDLSRAPIRSAEDQILDEAERLDSQSEEVSQREWRDVGDERPTLFNAGARVADDFTPPIRTAKDKSPRPRHTVKVLTDVDIIGRPPASEQGDDEGEDPFETDSRQPDPTRSENIKTQLRRSLPLPSPSMAPPPRPSQRPPSSSGSVAIPPPSSFRQRVPWSEEDCRTLVRLIAKRHAAWSVIESTDSELFRHPRNQQAYRDKARNMKVDILLADQPLPPRFDLVALSQKEIKKVAERGKNPFRREDDIDEHDNVINTEYAAQDA